MGSPWSTITVCSCEVPTQNEAAEHKSASLFIESGDALLDQFEDINTLVSFLEGRAQSNAASCEQCAGINT
jgi:hypothetical protein